MVPFVIHQHAIEGLGLCDVMGHAQECGVLPEFTTSLEQTGSLLGVEASERFV